MEEGIVVSNLRSIYVGYTVWEENDGQLPISVWSLASDEHTAKQNTLADLINFEAYDPDEDVPETFEDAVDRQSDGQTVVEEWRLDEGYVVVPEEHLRLLYELWYRSHDVSLLAVRRHVSHSAIMDAYLEAHFEASRSHSDATKAFAKTVYDTLNKEREAARGE